MSKAVSSTSDVHGTSKVTLITGASSGIGAGLALRYAKRGDRLILLARRQEKLMALAEELRGFGARVEVVAVDVTDREALEQKLTKACEILGPVDLLIANPPRAGLREGVRLIGTMRPRRVFLMSCDVKAFARDLTGILGFGYEIERVDGYDMFPHTDHVEVTALLRRC